MLGVQPLGEFIGTHAHTLTDRRVNNALRLGRYITAIRTKSHRAERTKEQYIMTTNYEQIYNLLITSQPIT